MKERQFRESLTQVIREAPVVPLHVQDKIVVFSDLHLGNGGSRDDFRPNSDLFLTVLQGYYLNNDFKLVLNGDIEELQRFKLDQIMRRWGEVYRLFRRFEQKQAFYKIIGNHDHDLQHYENPFLNSPIYKALILDQNGHHIEIFHGHQASLIIGKYHSLCKLVLKYIANPIGIKNYTFSYQSKFKFKTENLVYNFAKDRKVVNLIGHTHRPLFEAPPLRGSLDRPAPCVFNSGSAIGKNGMTALEISGGSIALVHWFDGMKNSGMATHYETDLERLGETCYYRVVIRQDNLESIFSRIKMLA